MSKIIEINNLFNQKKINKNELLKDTFNKLDNNKKLNAYINIVNKHDNVVENKSSLLNNIPYAIKDNINALDTITTGGSLFFENYKSCYDATVITLLNNAGAIPVAKANLDEFGLGGTGTFSGFGNVINPYNEDRITSGSSSGSAVLVAKDIVPFALGTDTGDSIRKPASYLGIVGYKPSYGLISRYGVFPYAPSLDHVGLLTKSVTDVAIISDVICAYDENDFTSQIQKKHDFYKDINDLKNKYKIVYFKNIIDFMPDNFKKIFLESIEKLNNKNCEIKGIDFPKELIEAISPIYKIISYSEAVSCYQNITGITFGHKENGKDFEESISKTRSKYFGNELKRRFVFGSYCTLKDNYDDVFVKSKKIRKIIVDKTEEILKDIDFVVMPSSSTDAPTIKDLESKKYKDTLVDDYLQIANFGGYPSITIPMYSNKDSHIGINFMAKVNDDKELLKFAKHSNSILNMGD